MLYKKGRLCFLLQSSQITFFLLGISTGLVRRHTWKKGVFGAFMHYTYTSTIPGSGWMACSMFGGDGGAEPIGNGTGYKSCCMCGQSRRGRNQGRRSPRVPPFIRHPVLCSSSTAAGKKPNGVRLSPRVTKVVMD